MIITKQDTLQTLAKKYGTTPEAIIKANPNIGTEAWIGSTVNVPGSSTLDKTLPKVGDESSSSGPGLPPAQGGSLAAFSSIMKDVMNKAAGKAKDKGLNVMQDRMSGLRMPGASLASIMDVVEGQTTKGFKDIYTSTISYFEEARQSAESQLKMIIDANALPNLNANQISQLATASNKDVNVLLAIQKSQESEIAYTGLLSVTEAKSLGVPYGTTKQQAVAMGITPSAPGDDSSLSLSNTQLLKMAEKGLPQLIAQDIAGYSGAGYSFDRIYEMMSKQFGTEEAGEYINTYRDIVTTIAGFTLVQPDVEIRKDYAAQGREDAQKAEALNLESTTGTETTPEATSEGIDIFQKFKWFINPMLWS